MVLYTVGGLIFVNIKKSENSNPENLPQNWHLNGLSKNGLSNDTQSILKIDGKYELFYLVDTGKGLKSNQKRTRWTRAISSDLTTFKTVDNVDIQPNSLKESVATGSIVKDEDNRAGYGENSLLAYATKYIKGNQWIYMWYSVDRGEKWYVANNGKPVAKPYKKGKDFRDPNVIYDPDSRKLIMTVAEMDDSEHSKIGFYTSEDGIKWKYTDSFYSPRDLGVMEVPEVQQIYKKDTHQKKWILFFSANGFADDFQKSTGSYYVVGQLKNGYFKTESNPERVDYGTDYYAAHNYKENNRQLLGLGWMGNWNYITHISDNIKYKGNYSAFRKFFLSSGNKIKTSSVITNGVFKTRKNSVTVEGHSNSKFITSKNAYKMSVFLNGEQKINIESSSGDSNIDFHFNNFNKELTVRRKSDYVTEDSYSDYYRVKLWGKWSEKVIFYVDKYSVEVYWPNTGQIATFARYTNDGKDQIVFNNLENKNSYIVVQEMK